MSDQAIPYYTTIVAQNPDDSKALNNYAALLMQIGRDEVSPCMLPVSESGIYRF
jgi:hypothetical protein